MLIWDKMLTNTKNVRPHCAQCVTFDFSAMTKKLSFGVLHADSGHRIRCKRARWTRIFNGFRIAFITGNRSLEPLLEGLLAQIHIDFNWWGFGRNRTGDLWITQICQVPRSSPLSYGDGYITEDDSGPSFFGSVLRSGAECCRVLQSVAECCRVLQSVAVRCSVLQCIVM